MPTNESQPRGIRVIREPRDKSEPREIRIVVDDGPGTLRHALRDKGWAESLRSSGEIIEQTRENGDAG